jgi:hypothetical protein
MRRALSVLLAAAVTASWAATTAVEAGAAQKTRLQIEVRRHDGRIFIYGGIIAKDLECRLDRKVTVRVDGDVIGSGRSRNGYWEIKPFTDPPGDTPRVIKASVKRGSKCGGASERITRAY